MTTRERGEAVLDRARLGEATAALDAFAGRLIAEQRIPGLAYALTDRERTLHVHCTGYADLAAKQRPTGETLWQIGSISKSFAAVVVLQLAAGGDIDLHAPAVRYLHWFGGDPAITVHQLLSHTSGLAMGSEYAPDSRYEVVNAGACGRPSTPGTRFHYSNVGYEAIGYILEGATGDPLQRILAERVLGPCGMSHSVAAVVADDYARSARAHRPLRDDRPYDRRSDQVPASWFGAATADGSISSTPTDLAAYLRMLLRGGETDGGMRLLAQRDHELLIGPHAQRDSRSGYGYGVSTVWLPDGTTRIGHSGGMVGMYASMYGDPAAGVGVVVMINGTGDETPLVDHALDTLRALRADAPVPVPPRPSSEPEPVIVGDGDAPDGLLPLCGVYRSHTPWEPCLRVVADRGGLHLVTGSGSEPLIAAEERSFAIATADSPERLGFAAFLDGAPLIADLSGCRYYRSLQDRE